MIRAPGCSRRARRIAWRAWRSASAVTAQVLTMTASWSPAVAAARRMMSLSNALSRQPKVTTWTSGIASGGIASAGEQRGIDAALEGERRRPGHHHVPIAFLAIGTPQDVEIAAVERDHRVAIGQPAAMGGDECGAGGAAARQGFTGTAFPDAQPDPPAVAHRRDPDIGALGEQLVVFEKGTKSGKVDRIGITDKERRVRVADAGADRARERPEGEIDGQRVHFAGER